MKLKDGTAALFWFGIAKGKRHIKKYFADKEVRAVSSALRAERLRIAGELYQEAKEWFGNVERFSHRSVAMRNESSRVGSVLSSHANHIAMLALYNGEL